MIFHYFYVQKISSSCIITEDLHTNLSLRYSVTSVDLDANRTPSLRSSWILMCVFNALAVVSYTNGPVYEDGIKT